MPPDSGKAALPTTASFPPTRWTLIKRVQAGGRDAAGAMEELCRSYWYPIYAYARHAGFPPHDAEDLTQTFFQGVVNYRSIEAVDREKGRMRTFMLTLLKRVIANHHRHESAGKRGGGQKALALDPSDAEERYAREPVDPRSTEEFFDRTWAQDVLAAATSRLRAEYGKAQNLDTWEALAEFLPLGENATPYAEVAARLQMREPTLRLQIHRMRKRYAKLIEEEVAATVTDLGEVKGELEHLMAVIGR